MKMLFPLIIAKIMPSIWKIVDTLGVEFFKFRYKESLNISFKYFIINKQFSL